MHFPVHLPSVEVVFHSPRKSVSAAKAVRRKSKYNIKMIRIVLVVLSGLGRTVLLPHIIHVYKLINIIKYTAAHNKLISELTMKVKERYTRLVPYTVKSDVVFQGLMSFSAYKIRKDMCFQQN